MKRDIDSILRKFYSTDSRPVQNIPTPREFWLAKKSASLEAILKSILSDAAFHISVEMFEELLYYPGARAGAISEMNH